MTQKERLFLRRKGFKDRGLCVRCGKNPHRPDKLDCQDCYIKEWTKKNNLRDAKMCTTCGHNIARIGRDSCVECRKKERDKELRLYNERKAGGLCVKCGSIRPSHNKLFCPSCHVKSKENVKRSEKNIKDIVFTRYGGYKCSCPDCNITEPKVLCIDHINNDGAQQRRETKQGKGTHLYRWIIKNNFPASFQVLCQNCNIGKHLNNGTCPIHGKRP